MHKRIAWSNNNRVFCTQDGTPIFRMRVRHRPDMSVMFDIFDMKGKHVGTVVDDVQIKHYDADEINALEADIAPVYYSRDGERAVMPMYTTPNWHGDWERDYIRIKPDAEIEAYVKKAVQFGKFWFSIEVSE